MAPRVYRGLERSNRSLDNKRAVIEGLAHEAASDGKETATELRTQIKARLAELDKQEDRYLDKIGDPEWPEEKIKKRLQDVRQETARLRGQLEMNGNELDTGRDVIATAAQLLSHPQELYRALKSERAKKVLNQAVFNKLYVDYSTDPYVVWSMEDRLSAETIAAMIADYRTGSIGKEIAEKYGISLSSVRRLMRKHGGRLKDKPE